MQDKNLAQVLTAMPVPALIIDANERVSATNLEARTLLGQQIEGRHFTTILRQPDVTQAIEATLRDFTPRTARFLYNDGAHDTTFELAVRPIGTSRDIMVSFQDVTYLEQADQMRRDFVAKVSHELRTPLTALIGFIETLRGAASDDADARERFLGIMADEAGRMNRLVGDLLSLSRVEGQERNRPREMVDLSGLLDSVLKSLKPLGDEDQIAFDLDLPDEPVIVPGDPDQLRQVFTNLAENAIKYGGAGGVLNIVLRTTEREAALRGPGARVQVIDHGPGIDPLHLPRLTERFYRADNHRSRMLGGTGLGLAIVKHIVNRHRGRLRVESELGQGATFTVILPLT